MPGQVRQIKSKPKTIEKSAKNANVIETIPDKWIGKDWYAFITCQTEDGVWHDDPNKYLFEVKKP